MAIKIMQPMVETINLFMIKNSQLYIIGVILCFMATFLVRTMNANSAIVENAIILTQLF